MALFSDSHSVAPSAGACQEVRLPELEPGLVYTKSSQKYGCIIIEVVSFNVASLQWKPLRAWSASIWSAWWNSDRVWREHFCGECFLSLFLTEKKVDSWWNQICAKQANMNHEAAIEISAVVQRINTESKYYPASQDQARFCEFSSAAECSCSIPAWPQTHKQSNRSRQTHKCVSAHKHTCINKHKAT